MYVIYKGGGYVRRKSRNPSGDWIYYYERMEKGEIMCAHPQLHFEISLLWNRTGIPVISFTNMTYSFLSIIQPLIN